VPTTIEVFDPAMCCSTGVCGPSVEPDLARFAGDLSWIDGQGVGVRRYNLGQEPGAFATRDIVRSALESGGEKALPVILVDGRLKWIGHYPTREELAAADLTVQEDGCCGGPVTVQLGDEQPTAGGCC